MGTGGDMFVSSEEKGMKEGQEMKERILYVADGFNRQLLAKAVSIAG
jgi:hypothetical protein